MEENTFIKAFGISYAGTLPKIRKSAEPLQPIFEAFTNSLEAISLLQNKSDNGQITNKLKLKSTLFSKEQKSYDFEEIIIEDTGIGFTKEEFERLENLNDDRKGFFNKGSGRVQLLHFFDRSEYLSIFRDETSKTGFKERSFTLSKSDAFLKQNAIVFCKSLKEVSAQSQFTSITLKTPLSEKDKTFYKELNIEELKKNIISHYLAHFCENRDALPDINLQYYIDNKLKKEKSVKSENIPAFDQQKDLALYYCKMSPDGRSIVKSYKKEILNLKAFKIPKDKLAKNGLMLISKGEIAKDIKLDSLLVDDYIEDYRYLFLISGNYINNKDTDTRGKLNIPTLDEFKKSFGDSSSLFTEEEILMDDIQDKANENILLMYDEIKKKTEEKGIEVDKLQKMFLLNPQTIKEAKIKLNDSEDEILKKVYQADAKVIAKNDAEIKKQFERLIELNPTSKDYNTQLENEVNELVKIIPLQNRTTLTHYVARRKLVIDLFRKILDKELKIQENNPRNINEKLLHNLIFQQSSDNTNESDLWLVNEDFIYFKGTSEGRLNDIAIDGQKIIRDNLSKDEQEFRLSLGEDRLVKKPDILLFPKESKCIIIEFKNPDVNVSDHLNQINNYATLIRNFAIPEYQFHTFFGYLIGEKINPFDVRAHDAEFIEAYHFDYLFRPNKTIAGMFIKGDASLYTEVIKYSTLLERAKLRNEIFIEKLTKPVNK